MQLDGMSIKAVLESLGYSLERSPHLYCKRITDCDGVEVGHLDAREAVEFLERTGTYEVEA